MDMEKEFKYHRVKPSISKEVGREHIDTKDQLNDNSGLVRNPIRRCLIGHASC